MKRKIACLVVLAYVVTILLLLFRQNINTEMLNGIMYIFGVIAFISFLFGVAERAQLYRFWPKREILMNTPTWFKSLWWISLLFVLYLAFAGGFEFGEVFVLMSFALGTAYLAPYLFVDKITSD